MTTVQKDKTITCEILRDFWDDDGNRNCAGSVIEVSVEVALDGGEAGSLRRQK